MTRIIKAQQKAIKTWLMSSVSRDLPVSLLLEKGWELRWLQQMFGAETCKIAQKVIFCRYEIFHCFYCHYRFKIADYKSVNCFTFLWETWLLVWWNQTVTLILIFFVKRIFITSHLKNLCNRTNSAFHSHFPIVPGIKKCCQVLTGEQYGYSLRDNDQWRSHECAWKQCLLINIAEGQFSKPF